MSVIVERQTGADDAREAAQWRPLILAVLLLALVLRLMAAEVVERHVREADRAFFVEGDANGYWHLGKAIASGEDYMVHQPSRRVLRVPGFPLLLASSIRTFGERIFPARCILAVVGAGCCWLTWLLGKQLVMCRVGFWAALLMAVHPLQIGSSVLILSENCFTFWMLAGLLALVKLIDRPRGTAEKKSHPDVGMLGHSLLAGGLIAMAVLVRPGFILWMMVAVTAVLLLSKQRWGTRLTLSAMMIVAFGAVMLPWAVRNHSVTGHWVLTSLWSGPSLYDGLNPEADGSSNMQFFDRDEAMVTMSEYDMNAHYHQLAVQFIKEHPGRTLILAGRKLVRFLQLIPNFILAGWVLWVVCSAAGLVFSALCLAGIRSRLFNPVGLLVVLGPFFLFMGVHMVFVGSLRYRLPAEFPLAILAAAGLHQWLPVRKQG